MLPIYLLQMDLNFGLSLISLNVPCSTIFPLSNMRASRGIRY